MKNLSFLLFALAFTLFVSCGNNEKKPQTEKFEQNDSLQKIISQKDNEINDMMETFNQIQEGLREINEAENRVNIVKDGEGANKRRQIVENIQFIQNTMKQNRALIEKLRQQMRESSIKGDNMRKTIDELVKQLEEKDQQLRQLRAELDSKDIHIAELDKTVSTLNDNVSTLKTESSQKTETINAQDKQLNTAWLVSHAVRSGGVDDSLVELKHHLGFCALDVFTLCDALWQLIDICIKTYAQEALLGENLLYKFFSVHNMVFTMIHRSDNRNDE